MTCLTPRVCALPEGLRTIPRIPGSWNRVPFSRHILGVHIRRRPRTDAQHLGPRRFGRTRRGPVLLAPRPSTLDQVGTHNPPFPPDSGRGPPGFELRSFRFAPLLASNPSLRFSPSFCEGVKRPNEKWEWDRRGLPPLVRENPVARDARSWDRPDHGLLRRLPNGVYTITQKGEAYLEGKLNAEELTEEDGNGDTAEA